MLRAFLTIGAIQALVMAVSLLRVKGLTWLLGADGYGVMGVIDSTLILVATPALCAMNYGAVRFLPPLWMGDKRGFAALFRAMRNLVLSLSAVAALGGLLLGLFAPGVFEEKLRETGAALPLAFLCVPTIALLPFVRNAIAARLQHARSMLFFLGHTLVFTAAALLGVLWNGLAGYYLLYALGGAALMLGVLRWYARGVPVTGPVGRPEGAALAGLPPVVWRLSGAYLAIHVGMAASEWFLKVHMLDVRDRTAAGLLNVLLVLSMAVRETVGAANQVLLGPQVNKEGAFEDRVGHALHYQKLLCVVCAAITPPLVLFPDVLLRVLSTTEYLPAAPYLMLFVVAEILLLLAQILATLIVSGDHYPFHVFQGVTGYLLRIVLAALLIGPFGLLGAGLAQLVTPVTMLALAGGFLVWRHRMKVPARNLLLALYTLGGVLAAGWVGTRWPGLQLGPSLGKLATWAVLLAGLWALLGARDRAELRRRVAARLSR